jgi:hypothetical protein
MDWHQKVHFKTRSGQDVYDKKGNYVSLIMNDNEIDRYYISQYSNENVSEAESALIHIWNL